MLKIDKEVNEGLEIYRIENKGEGERKGEL